MLRHDHVLLLPALMRSGHHAIIRWIQSHFASPQYELNDAVPFKRPFRDNWHEPHDPPSEDTVLATLNFEDVDLSRCRDKPLLDLKWLGEVGKCQSVLVLRDPYNLLASKLQLIRTRAWWREDKQRASQTPADIIRLWKTLAQEFLGKTSFLGTDADVVKVSFNHWFQSKDYRDSIGSQLGFCNQDHSLTDVGDRGQGSSFDYRSHDGDAQSMRVLDRWRGFINDPDFQLVIHDNELLDLADRTTGVPDGWPFTE